MERILRDQMLLHLIENNLIDPSQHGFMPGKSCHTNLLETLDVLTAAMKDKKTNRFLLIAIIKDMLDLNALQEDIDRLVEWSIKWKMCFTKQKCKSMFFDKRRHGTLNRAQRSLRRTNR
jgi:hypothetical protein